MLLPICVVGEPIFAGIENLGGNGVRRLDYGQTGGLMARFVWRTGRGSAKRYCWDTDNRVFAARSKCPGGGPPREKPKRKRGKIGAAPPGRPRHHGRVEGDARFVWRKMCWDFDTDKRAPMSKCKVQGYVYEPSDL